MRTLFAFVREARVELSKVTWPTQDQIIKNTVLVIGLSAALAVFLGSLDYGFSTIIQKYLI